MTGFGNILGYVAGSLSLSDFFATPSITQFQWLTAWASLYTQSIYKAAPSVSDDARIIVIKKAMHVGTSGNLAFAIVALTTNILLQHFVEAAQMSKETFLNRSLNIQRLWLLSHIFFAGLMLATQFVTTSSAGTIVVACAGLSWALTGWAPYTIIGSELADIVDSTEELEKVNHRGTAVASIMGLHNAFMSAPQILAAILCSIILALSNAFESTWGLQWVFLLGFFTSLAAAYTARDLK
ncbi:hypothetical protein N0V90_004078 [Kalmusia sp. IMI 367209]|nr:hypothetical protein N0V90_004078 [Kalmusia sp. IMI 367209]